MRTRFKKLILAVMLAISLPSFAHDFEVDGIYYNILSSTDKTVSVAYRGDSYDSYINEYTGSVTIPETVTYSGTTYSVSSIGDNAFEGCSGLTEVTIPNSVTLIGLCAFKDCTGLTSITIPDSVTSIYNNAFSGCNGLVEVNITDLSAWCKIDFDVINANPLQYAHHLKLNGAEITNLVIPYGITEIKNQAFGLCTGLTSVTIPNSVISIGELAFALCSGLTEVTIGNSVTFIGDYAFKDCNGLSRITSHIPADKLFALDSSVLDATIKENCTLFVPFGAKDTYATTDGWGEFTNIEELEELNNCGESAYWSLNKETGVLTISGTGAMYDYESGGSPWYNNRSDIKSIEIGSNITSIGNYAFYKCSGLTSVTIPNSVTYIGEDAFEDCTAMTKLYSKAIVPPTCGSQALDDINKWNCELYVPQASIADYQAAEQWKEFFFIKDIESGVEDVYVEEVAVTVEGGEIIVKNVTGIVTVYNLNGIAVATEIADGNEVRLGNLQPGVYIVVVNNKSVKVVL